MSQLAIIARVSLSPDSATKYLEAAKALIEPTLAEAGCELYAIASDINDPTVVWISEQWASLETLHAHLGAPHIQSFLALVANLEILDMDIRQYEVASVGPIVMPG